MLQSIIYNLLILCHHCDLQLPPHIFPFMDRRHGSDAWPDPCAWTRAPNPCETLAFLFFWCFFSFLSDLATVHSRRSRHTCGHFLLPIPAIVACAHLRLQPIRCILPHDMQEKGKRRVWLYHRRPTHTGVCLNNACSHGRADCLGGRPPLLSNSTAPQTRESVFVSRLTASGWINSQSPHRK